MTISRRRFLTIASAACLTSAATIGRADFYRWQGMAIGARAQIILDHPKAAQISLRAQVEIERLEKVFSLYRADSQLVELNQTGHLRAPAFELLECLSIARRVHAATEARFDPTVQPLWQLMAQASREGRAVDPAQYAIARDLIGFDRVGFDSAEITLEPGQSLTLNGIAQGYIADRVARLMRAEGVDDVLIDTGEITALGVAPGQHGWPVTIKGETVPRMLKDRAIATSAMAGTLLDAGKAGKRQGHILDPRAGISRIGAALQVSVSAPSAALADGLSTGLVLVGNKSKAQQIVSAFAGVKLLSYMA